jgi:DTW domain-containing protein YfiP
VHVPRGRGYRSLRCDGCGLRIELCICSQLPQFSSRTLLHLTLHCQELRKPSGTARLLRRLLPDHEFSTYGDGRMPTRGVDVLGTEQLADPVPSDDTPSALATALPSLILYPDPGAPTLEELTLQLRGPVRLIVPDGTWTQTQRWRKRAAPWREARVVRIDNQRTRYFLRRTDDPVRLCTFEAVAYALSHLESPELGRNLLEWFELWKSKALASRAGGLPNVVG